MHFFAIFRLRLCLDTIKKAFADKLARNQPPVNAVHHAKTIVTDGKGAVKGI
jgi:hypothetical protein